MGVYISDNNGNLTKVGGLTGNSIDKANIDLSNVSYPSNIIGSTQIGAGDRVIETYISSNGKTWYRKWASGWKECGIHATPSHTEYGWTMPISFSNTDYVSIANCYTSGYLSTVRIYNRTQSYILLDFGYYTTYANANDVYVYCCGY